MPDEILSARKVFEGWVDLLMLRVRIGGEEVDRPVIDHPSGAAVLPYDSVRRVALLSARHARLCFTRANRLSSKP